jgi:hypothetical protein
MQCNAADGWPDCLDGADEADMSVDGKVSLPMAYPCFSQKDKINVSSLFGFIKNSHFPFCNQNIA